MYFDYTAEKWIALTTLVTILAGAVCITLVTLVQNEERITELSNFAARIESELSYVAFFKAPETNALALASGAYTTRTSTYAGGSMVMNAHSIPVLLYHGENGDASSMSTETFVDQLRTLKAAGWQTVTLAQFESFMKGEMNLPDKSFLLTFDDGRKDTFYTVDPLLKDLHYTAVMFVITGLSLPNNGGKAVDNFYLSKSELAYMAKSGRWDLESHGDQDHRGYAVPTATSTPETVTFLNSQHFLSNRFWVPSENRFESVAEYSARISEDLATSKALLAQDFTQTVTAYAYPFNDFGEDTVNFPGSTSIIASAVASNYDYAFYQTWDGNGDSFNYPDPSAFMIKRIEPLATWSGKTLLSVLTAGKAKALPFGAMAFTEGWQTNWGVVGKGAALSLSAAPDTTGAAAFLDGTESWSDYKATITATISTGTLSLIARHTEADAPYVVCAFSNDRIYLEKHTGETQTTLAVTPYTPASDTRDVSMSVNGSVVTCEEGGVSARAIVPNVSPEGGIGVSVWDPENGSAHAIITRLTAHAL